MSDENGVGADLGIGDCADISGGGGGTPLPPLSKRKVQEAFIVAMSTLLKGWEEVGDRTSSTLFLSHVCVRMHSHTTGSHGVFGGGCHRGGGAGQPR